MKKVLFILLCFVIILSGCRSKKVTPETNAMFPDPCLEVAIREAIGKPTGDIEESDLVELTHLDASKCDIQDLSGLEYCVNLETSVLCPD